MIVSSPRMSMSFTMPDSLTVGASSIMFSSIMFSNIMFSNVMFSSITFSQSVKTLGVKLDTHLTMKNQVINLVRTANFEPRRINSIRHYFSVEATQKLVLAFVMSRLDYCNSLLYGCPQ